MRAEEKLQGIGGKRVENLRLFFRGEIFSPMLDGKNDDDAALR